LFRSPLDFDVGCTPEACQQISQGCAFSAARLDGLRGAISMVFVIPVVRAEKRAHHRLISLHASGVC